MLAADREADLNAPLGIAAVHLGGEFVGKLAVGVNAASAGGDRHQDKMCVRRFGGMGRIAFSHVRNVKRRREKDGSIDFYDAAHFSAAGSLDMYAIMRAYKDIGFDGYMKAMDCLKPGDVVILATPPAFRWVHFGHAIEKGLHTFMEKPTTVDGPSTRKMLKLAEESEKRKTS